jgi:Ca2+-binding RTX toxin-like protein
MHERPSRRGRLACLALCALVAPLTAAAFAPQASAQVTCDIVSDAAVIVGTSQSDVICAGDSANVIYGGLLDDQIYGGGGNDVIIGGHGVDFMHGQTGNDLLRGGTNRDCYVGGADNDTASFASFTPSGSAGGSPNLAGVTADLTAESFPASPPPSCAGFEGAGVAFGEGYNEELVGIENLVGSPFADDLEAANTGVNDIRGGWGDDIVRGRGGNDGLFGENGSDQCRNDGNAVACDDAPEGSHRPAEPVAFLESHGPETGLVVLGREGTSDDVLAISRPSSSEVRIDFDEDPAATASCPQTGATTLTCSISTPDYIMAWGDQGNDTVSIAGTFPDVTSIDLNGGPGSDSVTGGPNGDILFTGEGGADQLIGNDGTDALISEGDPVGSGGDYLAGGNGNDQLVTDNACAGHTLWGGPDTGSGPVGDIIGFARQTDLGLPGNPRGVWAKLGEGSTQGDAYAIPTPAGCVNSKINGGGEVLEGTSQADELRGNDNHNTIWGRDGQDEVFGLGGDDVVHGHAAADEVYGNAGNDTVWGESGPDSLFGGDGSDRLRALDNRQDTAVNCGANDDFAAEADPNDPVVSCGEL